MPTLSTPPTSAADPVSGGTPRGRSLRILVADADPAGRELYRRALAALGHQVCPADTARQLLDLCRAVTPDLVIIDAAIPDTDAFELAAAVCRDRPVAVLLASADPDPTPVWGSADCRVLGYLAKPLRAEAVGAAVAVAVRCFDRLRALGEEVAQLRQALEDRKLIERAKGLLMRLAGLDEDDAYRRMRGLATRGGRRLVEVARDIVAAGEVFGQLIEDGHAADGPARVPGSARADGNGARRSARDPHPRGHTDETGG